MIIFLLLFTWQGRSQSLRAHGQQCEKKQNDIAEWVGVYCFALHSVWRKRRFGCFPVLLFFGWFPHQRLSSYSQLLQHTPPKPPRRIGASAIATLPARKERFCSHRMSGADGHCGKGFCPQTGNGTRNGEVHPSIAARTYRGRRWEMDGGETECVGEEGRDVVYQSMWSLLVLLLLLISLSFTFDIWPLAHWVQLEQPKELIRILLRWFQTLQSAAL